MATDKFIGDRTWRCPDEMRLAAFVEQRLTAPERSRVEAHVAGCDYCLGQVGALARLQDAAPPADVPKGLVANARQLIGGDERAVPAWRWGAAAVATACVALTVTLWIREPRAGVVPQTVRSVAGHAAAVPELLSPRESSIVPRAALEFRWNRVERTLFYEVRVVSADGDLVWETRTEQAETRMPLEIRLTSGQRYYVSVSAWPPEGKTLKSPVIGFQVAGR